MKKRSFSHKRVLSVFVMLVLSLTALASAQQVSYEPQAGAMLGNSVAVGDLNGDGLGDIVAGVPLYDIGTPPLDFGLCRCISGDQAIFAVEVREVLIEPPTRQHGGKFCFEVTVGDVNNDGFQDLVVGEAKYDVGTQRDVGRVHVYLGSANFFNATPAPITIENPEPGIATFFGVSLATGDLNRDGFDDILVGAPGASNEQGRVYYYQGGAMLSTRPALTLSDPQPEAGARFGATLATGDVNNDRIKDLVVGAPHATTMSRVSAGKVLVFFGATPFNTAVDVTLLDPAPELGALFGQGLAVGDVNGDRIGDIISSSPNADVSGRNTATDAGEMFIFFGGATVDTGVDAILQFGDGETSERLAGSAHLGLPVVTGDFDGDRIDDVIASATGLGRNNGGRVFLYYGGPPMVPVRPGTPNTVFPHIVFELGREQEHAQFARALATGDVNGDLVEDIVYGVPLFDGGPREELIDSGEIFISPGIVQILGNESKGKVQRLFRGIQ